MLLNDPVQDRVFGSAGSIRSATRCSLRLQTADVGAGHDISRVACAVPRSKAMISTTWDSGRVAAADSARRPCRKSPAFRQRRASLEGCSEQKILLAAWRPFLMTGPQARRLFQNVP